MRTLLGLLLVSAAQLGFADSQAVAKASCHKQLSNGYTSVRPIRSNQEAKRCISRGGEVILLELEKDTARLVSKK